MCHCRQRGSYHLPCRVLLHLDSSRNSQESVVVQLMFFSDPSGLLDRWFSRDPLFHLSLWRNIKIKTDNNTADGFVKGTIKQNKTKVVEMRFDWLKCRSAQLKFDIYWAPGQENFADFFTKNHSAAHHKALRPIYLAPDSTNKQLSIQGCIKILQPRLTKAVALKTQTKLLLVPVTSKPFSYK